MLDLTTAGRDEVNAALEANMVAHMSYFHAAHPSMYVDRRPDLVIIDSGLPCDTYNQVCRARLARETAAARIAEAVGHFRRAARPFSWWLGPGDRPDNLSDLLRAAGLRASESEVAMAMDLRALPPNINLPAGLRIERVTSVQQLEDYVRVEAANWDPPDPWVGAFYRTVRDLALAPESLIWFYVGYVGSDPVAASEVCFGGGVAGIYGVATLASARRRGYGTALTLQPLYDARVQGYRTATLQASDDGKGVYARIGFTATGRFTEFQPA